MILSVNQNLFYGRVYHDVPGTYIVWQTEKVSKKHPAFKDKSDDIKKVVIVSRRLMWNFICTTIFSKIWCVLWYCTPNSKVYKKKVVFLYSQKLSIKSQLSTPI